MLRSIRWTLQLWHAAILALALVGFGAASYYEVSRARFKEVDAELEGAGHVLLATLRRPPRPGQPRPNPPPPRPEFRRDRPAEGEWAPPPPFDASRSGPRPGELRRRPPPLDDGPPPDDDPTPRGGPPTADDLPPWARRRPEDPRPEADRPEGGSRKIGSPEGRRLGNGGPDAEAEWALNLPAGFLGRPGEPLGGKLFFAVYRGDGARIKASDDPAAGFGRGAVPASLEPVTDLGERERSVAAPPRWSHADGLRKVILTGPLGTRVLVGRSVRMEQEQLRGLAWLMAGTGAALLFVGLMGGWLLSRRAVRPIGAMTETAQALSATHLSGRIDADRVPGELAALARVLNAAFARLESAFHQQARFTADASHELRTPLAVIHSHAELALSRDRSPGEYRQTLATCLKASGRMNGLVESLLLLARADGGGLELDVRPFDLRDVAEDSASLLASLAQEAGVGVETDLSPVLLAGDATRVGQVVTNLLANAIRHNREGGRARVTTAAEESDAVLTVIDTGPGIAPEDQPHVFERFFRADKARSRKAGGSGLGLAICKSIVEAHRGTISFSSEASRGTTFTVRLPRNA